MQASPERLRAHGIALPQLSNAIANNNTAQGGAAIQRSDSQQIVRGLASGRGWPRHRQHRGANCAGRRARPRVGRALGPPKARLGAVAHDGEGETVVGVADMQYGLNASEVLGPLKAAMADVQKTLPPGVEMRVFYDRSGLVGRAIRTVAHNLVEGALLVAAVLLAMLGSPRAGLVAAVIPLSMLSLRGDCAPHGEAVGRRARRAGGHHAAALPQLRQRAAGRADLP